MTSTAFSAALWLCGAAARAQAPDAMFPDSYRAARDGSQTTSALVAAGHTAWVAESGVPEAEDATVLFLNFSGRMLAVESAGESPWDVGVRVGGNLQFATEDGIVYAFTHFDGTICASGRSQHPVADALTVRATGEVCHESTHTGDSAIALGIPYHIDSAEWLGAELAVGRAGTVHAEVYAGWAQYVHSMPVHPIQYRGRLGGVVAEPGQRLALSAEGELLYAGAPEPDASGPPPLQHRLGGTVKLLYSPAASGAGVMVGFDAGVDPFGQVLSSGPNARFIAGIQFHDLTGRMLDRGRG